MCQNTIQRKFSKSTKPPLHNRIPTSHPPRNQTHVDSTKSPQHNRIPTHAPIRNKTKEDSGSLLSKLVKGNFCILGKGYY